MANIDPDTYDVYSYDTGNMLEGLPTEELVRESLAAGETGAVCATYDADAALWHYIPADERDAYEARGEHVRTVYVMASREPCDSEDADQDEIDHALADVPGGRADRRG